MLQRKQRYTTMGSLWKCFFSCFFIFLLFVPHILSWGHVISHEHEAYDNQLANVHEEEAKCYVCLLTRNSLDLSFSFSLTLFLLIFVTLMDFRVLGQGISRTI